MHRIRNATLGMLAVAMSALPANAQKSSAAPQRSAADVLKAANAKSVELDQLRQNLRSPDQSVRLSTFEAMVESNNPTLKELAISEGFAGTDEAMKTLAFRAAMIDVKRIHLDPVGLQPGQVYVNWETFQRRFDLQLEDGSYDWRSGMFCQRAPSGGCYNSPNYSGQISSRTFTYSYGDTPGCSGQLTNIEGTWEFEGPVRCRFNKTTLEGTFRLKLR